MGRKLVIVESPAKVKTIGKILGSGYVVRSSMGHVRDLPVKGLGVDIKNSFRPKYVIVQGRKKVIDALKSAAGDCEAVYLAPDPDREGEAIAWHLEKLLEKDAGKFHRVQYNEITPRAVRRAFDNPGDIDMNRVNAQQARRILDRIVGYKVSPVLWRRVKRGLSAGRVQSVALRLVCEREAKIQSFVPEEYWVMGAKVRKLSEPLDPFNVKLVRINGEKASVKTEKDALGIKKELDGSDLCVSAIRTKEVRHKPRPPHVTSTLQQAASGAFGFSPSRTMRIAQKLYEGVDLGEGPAGLITYMRTDSFSVAPEALNACRELINEKFGSDYLPEKPNFYKSRASAQEAHEAIRPTDAGRLPESIKDRLTLPEYKVYSLIWRRFVASQMTPARIEQRTVEVEAHAPGSEAATYLFRATSSDLKFPGYMKADGSESRKNKEAEEEQNIPPLSEGERLECLDWLSERKETKPPSRYSEASLIRLLEQNGVGRPSTYAQVISTLLHRKYATSRKRTLTPTELGMEVNGFLAKDLDELFNVKFTASMEESLDKVEDGEIKWTDMLDDFYRRFNEWLKRARGPGADIVKVKKVLKAMEEVKEWDPEVRRGKRVYSDRKFTESIQKQADKGEREISERQLNTLLKIAWRYRDRVPAVAAVVDEIGYKPDENDRSARPPEATTIRKLDLLKDVPLDEKAGDFVGSLRGRVEKGMALTDGQLRALNNIVAANSAHIENFEELRGEMDIENSAVLEDQESAPLLDALSRVQNWREPVKRGKKSFDDKSFYNSLLDHFSRKGFLSPKQRAALKKMVKKYRDQIPDYEQATGDQENTDEGTGSGPGQP
ncbi:MAG: type I DNA topoisomerase [Kiritimatiellia bacterium]